MTLFNPTTTVEEITVDPIVKQQTYSQDTVTIFENIDSPVNVSATLDGSPWSVLFINQLLRPDDIPRQLDLGLDPSLQQYASIEGFILGVTSSLTPSKDTSTGITKVTGAAQAYPSVQINVGDMFIGNQKDNRLGLFVVTSVERLQYIAGSAFEIEYRLYDYYNATLESNINSKIVKTFVFDETKVECGKSLIDKKLNRDIGLTLKELTNWFYDLFYDLETETFLLPYITDTGDVKETYDHFTTCFFSALVDYSLRGNNPKPVIYSSLNGEFRDNNVTVWDTLMTSSIRSLRTIKRNAEVISPYEFHSYRLHNSITVSNIKNVMWPGGVKTLNSGSRDDEGSPYVFTAAFYDNDELNMSVAERLVRDLLEGIPIDVTKLETVVNELDSLTTQDLFHRIPVVIWILKAYTR